MNYCLVNFGQVTGFRQKAMHKSPLCISTGGLKNQDFHTLRFGDWLPAEVKEFIRVVDRNAVLFSTMFELKIPSTSQLKVTALSKVCNLQKSNITNAFSWHLFPTSLGAQFSLS